MKPGQFTQELNTLTGIRALLAWWVTFYHLTIPELGIFSLGLVDPLRAKGYLGVDGFFILSGFIIAHVYRERFNHPRPGEFTRFLVARIARVYPLHLTMLLAVALLLIAATAFAGYVPRQPERFSVREFALHLLLLHGWGFSSNLAWNFPSWSVSAEWFAYLAFPVVHQLVLRDGSPRRAGLVAVLAVAGLAAFEQLGPNGSLSYTYEFALLRIGFEFVLGAALLMLAQPMLLSVPYRGRTLRPHALLALAGAAACTVIDLPDAACVACLAAAIFFLAHPGDLLGQLLATRPFVYGGETSYAVYMTHALVQTAGLQAVRGAPWLGQSWLFLPAMLIVVQALASLAYALVERPMRSALRRAGEAQLDRMLPRPAAH
jgi:peptidoglycan/LPS O-acetylase OafA/YrhL